MTLGIVTAVIKEDKVDCSCKYNGRDNIRVKDFHGETSQRSHSKMGGLFLNVIIYNYINIYYLER
jgi:hypothetical protein